MKGDFTRDTFDARKHFSRVLMQQGRVQLDADFNEQASILLHYIQTLAADLIGPYGGPQRGNGFVIGDLKDGDFAIGTGRYYVGGLLCENEPSYDLYGKPKPLGFLTQPYYPLPDSVAGDWRRNLAVGNWMIYLDVWEQHISAVQDDSLRESALVGPDTCSRARVVWQVRVRQLDGATCAEATRVVDTWNNRMLPTMRAQVMPEGPITDACSLPPESRYRGMENQLYRVEVHRSNVDDNGNIIEGATPTFKWSRDNGTAVYPIALTQGNNLTLSDMGRDARSMLNHEDWVEILDEANELLGVRGALGQIDTVDPTEMTVTLKPIYGDMPKTPTLLRRWDQKATDTLMLDEGAVPLTLSDKDWINLESGIQVQFPTKDSANGTTPAFRTGDYWLIPARVATGKIEWPMQPDANGVEQATAQEARGIRHYFAPLAVMVAGKVIENCRTCFEPNVGKECL